MGLNTTHDAFHGAYSAFNSLRQVVCAACGGSYPPHLFPGFNRGIVTRDDLLGKPKKLDESLIYFCPPGKNVDVPDGLFEFLTHSDCEGEISPQMCGEIADDLEELLPKIAAMTGTPWSGHIEAAGGYVEATKKFIDGCRKAYLANEPLEFY